MNNRNELEQKINEAYSLVTGFQKIIKRKIPLKEKPSLDKAPENFVVFLNALINRGACCFISTSNHLVTYSRFRKDFITCLGLSPEIFSDLWKCASVIKFYRECDERVQEPKSVAIPADFESETELVSFIDNFFYVDPRNNLSKTAA